MMSVKMKTDVQQILQVLAPEPPVHTDTQMPPDSWVDDWLWNFATKLNNLVIDFLNAWITYLEHYWWCIGIVFGICATLTWLNRDNKAGGLFASMAFTLGLA